MPGDEAPQLAAEGVFRQEVGSTAITLLWEMCGPQPISQRQIVVPFLQGDLIAFEACG